LSFLIFLFLPGFWFLHTARRALYLLWLWQKKQYRFDRFFEEAIRNKALFLPKTSLIALLLLLASFLLAQVDYLFDLTVFAFYLALGLYAVFLGLKQKWLLPKFTKKAGLIFAVAVGALLVLQITFYNLFFFYFVLISEVVLPLFLLLLFSLTQIPAFLWKKVVYRKAGRKRASLVDLTVIGITGSFGKTSTKDFLAHILSQKFKVLKTRANVNTEIGLAKAVLRELKPEHEVFVCEMAAYKRGEIKTMAKIVQPQVGILTGINEQHLALFGSQENIVKGKIELIEALPEDGTAIFNGNSEKISKLKSQTLKPASRNGYAIGIAGRQPKTQIFCSTKEKADIWAEDIKVGRDWLWFRAVSKDGDTASFNLKLVGRQNIINLLMAAACCKKLGMSLSEIAERAKALESPIKISKSEKGADIIDSTYSANPDGVLAHLEHLKHWPGKKFVIMPCLIELGKAAKEVHYRIGQKIAGACHLAVITNPYYFKYLKTGAIEQGMKEENILLAKNLPKVLNSIKAALKDGDVVLLEGRIPNAPKESLIKD